MRCVENSELFCKHYKDFPEVAKPKSSAAPPFWEKSYPTSKIAARALRLRLPSSLPTASGLV